MGLLRQQSPPQTCWKSGTISVPSSESYCCSIRGIWKSNLSLSWGIGAWKGVAVLTHINWTPPGEVLPGSIFSSHLRAQCASHIWGLTFAWSWTTRQLIENAPGKQNPGLSQEIIRMICCFPVEIQVCINSGPWDTRWHLLLPNSQGRSGPPCCSFIYKAISHH